MKRIWILTPMLAAAAVVAVGCAAMLSSEAGTARPAGSSPIPVAQPVEHDAGRMLARSARAQTISTFSQYTQMGLDSAPAARPAPVAVIDTAVQAGGRIYGGRVLSISGAPGAADAHGSLISSAITGSYMAAAGSNVGAATGSRVRFYGCGLADDIDLECALSALQAASTSGVRVINLSFETRSYVPPAFELRWRLAVAAAAGRGVLVVAATDDGSSLGFPARMAGTLSVARTRNGRAANTAAAAHAPGTRLATATAAGRLVSVSGASYSAAYVTAVAARIAGARPAISLPLLRRSVSGSVTLPRALRVSRVKGQGIGKPGCVRISGSTRRTLTWGRAIKAVRYRIVVGPFPQIIAGRRLTTTLAGKVSVQGIGAYGTIGPAASAC